MKPYKILLLSIFLILSSFVNGSINDSLLTHYTFNSVITDTLNNYDWTAPSSATYTTGKLGNAYDLDGTTGSYLYTSQVLSQSLQDDYSINLWIYIRSDGAPETISYILDFRNEPPYGIQLYPYYDEATNTIIHGVYDGSNSLQASTQALNNSQWYMVTMTYDGANIRIYLNGELEDTTATTIGPVNLDAGGYPNVYLGQSGGDWREIDAKIDELSIWDRNLTETEIINLWNNENGLEYPFLVETIGNFTVTAKSGFNISNSINNFSVNIDGLTYNTTNGTITTHILVNATETYNITITSNNWFNKTYNNYNISSNLQAELYQSQLNISPIELITNNSISNFSIKIDSDVVCNVTGDSCVFYPDANNYTLTLIDNTGLENYHTTSNNIEVAALDNKTETIYGHGHEILIYARTINNATINNFTATLTSLNLTDERSLNTTTGVINFDAIHNTYVLSVDAAGYALTDNQTITVDSSQQNFTLYFYHYTTNSIDFTFLDEETDEVIDGETISIELISDVFSSNYTTTNGTLYVDLLSPEFYTMRYSAASYNERFYYFTLINRTYTELDLYLLNNSETITISLYDQYNSYVEDAYIKILKYDLETNAYVIKEIVKTNFEGVAKFSGVLNTEYYKFIVEYPVGTTLKTTSPSYLYTNTLIIQIVTGGEVGNNFNNFASLDFTPISYNNATNNFRFTYNDNNNVVTEVCLNVYKKNVVNGDILLDDSCSSSSAATILAGLTPVNNTVYVAKAYATIDTETELIDSYILEYNPNKPNTQSDVFAAIFLTILVSLLGVFNIVMFILFIPLGIIFSILLGFLNIPLSVGVGLELIAVVIAIMISRKS